MCTVSWVRTNGGYHLFCNRDEKKTRPAALDPKVRMHGGVRFVAPIDSAFGGTWIAVNEHALSICLLNGRPGRVGLRSRGLLLWKLIRAETAGESLARLKHIDAGLFAPFTMLLLEPENPATVVTWDGDEINVCAPADSMVPLTSSSFDAGGVRDGRVREFHKRARQNSTSLLDFHASHGEQASAYSPCMHRQDAETVSFSWIQVTQEAIWFRYVATAPCKAARKAGSIWPNFSLSSLQRSSARI